MRIHFLTAKRLLFFTGILCLLILNSNAQQPKDNIYQIGEKLIKCDLVEITQKKIKYRDEHGKNVSASTEDVQMVFNKVGGFMLFPKKDLNPYNAADFVRSTQFPQADFIVTLDKKLIVSHIITKNENTVTYENIEVSQGEQTISLDLVALIIFKNGKHELFVHPSQASGVLTQVAALIKLYNETHYKNEAVKPKQQTAPIPSKEKSVEKTVPVKKEEPPKKEPSAPKEKVEKAEKVKEPKIEELKEKTPKEKDKTKEPKVVPVLPAVVKMDSAGYLTGSGMLVFNKAAAEKVLELGRLMSKIADANTDEQTANTAITQACGLFINEDARVEVLDNNDTDYKVRFKIRDLLNRLKSLKYSKVDVSWANVNYVSHLQKGVDGSYYGIITLQEKLQNAASDMPRYSDQIRKETEIIVKNHSNEGSGKAIETWDVVLSDIGIVITK